jgi:putative ABC transport system permease protein
MLRATLKSLLARKLRLLLTAIAVVLGVGFTAGTFVLTDTAIRSFDDLFGNVYEGTDVVVQGTSAFAQTGGGGNGGGGTERKPIPEKYLERVRSVLGVAAADGDVAGLAQIVDPATGDVIQNGQAPTIGNSWDPDVTSLQVASGAPPTKPDDVAIDAATAEDAGLAPGDHVMIVTNVGTRPFTVSGTVRFQQSESFLGATLAIFALPTAQDLFQREGEFDFIYVRGTEGTSPSDLAMRITAELPEGYQAVTGASAATEQQNEVNQGLGFLRTGLLVFGFVALFVGTFIIFNTFNIVVTQRSRELALFRALGASRRQVMGSVLIESVIVGLVASVVGIGVGIGLASLLKSALAAIGLKLPATGLVVSPRTIVVSLILGTGITVAAAISPARRASRLAPIEALRETSAPSASIRRRVIVGAVLSVMGVAAIGVGLFGHVFQAGIVVGVGAGLTFIGVAVLSPLFARPLSAAIGRPFRRRVAGRLGNENADRNPRRTASTAAALMIGLGLVAFVMVFAASLKASVTALFDRTIGADLVLSSSSFSGFSTQLARDLEQDAKLSAVSPVRQTEVQVKSSSDFVGGLDPATITNVMNMDMIEGSVQALSAPDTVIVTEATATSNGWRIGDTIDVKFAATGDQSLRVVGIFASNELLADYNVSLQTYDANVEQLSDVNVFLDVAPGVSIDEAKADVESLLKERYPNVDVNDQADFKQQSLRQVDSVFAIVYVLLALSIFISTFGIINTLGLSIYERIRELGLLRAIGMSRKQVRRMIRVEAVIIAILGALIGIVVGIAFGWVMQLALEDVGIDRLAIPFGQLFFVLVIAAVIGVVAAILPARRAAKIDVLSAIAYE